MLDDLHAHDGARDGREHPARPRVSNAQDPVHNAPLADREVPLEQYTRTPDYVHAWLDGELSTPAVQHADAARHVEFWSHLDNELELRRHMRAPAYLAERVMAAIAGTVPEAASPWWERPIMMRPITVIAVATGLIALGTAIGTSMRLR
jgi:hypothetical protein